MRSVEGATIMATPEASTALVEALAAVNHEDVQGSLEKEFRSQGSGFWVFSEQEAVVTIALGIDSVFLSQLNDEVLVLNTRISVRRSPSASQRAGETLVYSHTSGGYPPNKWSENDGALIDSELRIGIQKTVTQIINVLRPASDGM